MTRRRMKEWLTAARSVGSSLTQFLTESGTSNVIRLISFSIWSFQLIIQDNDTFECEDCHKMFKNEKNLRHHYKTHHELPHPKKTTGAAGKQESLDKVLFQLFLANLNLMSYVDFFKIWSEHIMLQIRIATRRTKKTPQNTLAICATSQSCLLSQRSGSSLCASCMTMVYGKRAPRPISCDFSQNDPSMILFLRSWSFAGGTLPESTAPTTSAPRRAVTRPSPSSIRWITMARWWRNTWNSIFQFDAHMKLHMHRSCHMCGKQFKRKQNADIHLMGVHGLTKDDLATLGRWLEEWSYWDLGWQMLPIWNVFGASIRKWLQCNRLNLTKHHNCSLHVYTILLHCCAVF